MIGSVTREPESGLSDKDRFHVDRSPFGPDAAGIGSAKDNLGRIALSAVRRPELDAAQEAETVEISLPVQKGPRTVGVLVATVLLDKN